YAEHPPGVAVLIWLGSSLFGGELGVRLLPVLLSGGVLYLLLQMEGGKAPGLLLMIGLSMIEFHAGGFLAVPDAGFIFFVSLFFFLFQRYIEAYRRWHILAICFTI
ncbi:MAG: glycosyltransferase family 39 protein, partial [Bacteroidota bacterium]